MTENHISEATLRGTSLGRVKDLSGFMRFHQEPDEHGPKAQRFIQIAGSTDLAGRAEVLFGAIRKALRYKRKEISLTCDEGGASIETPDFDVTLSLDQDPADAGGYALLTEVSGFRGGEIVTRPEFLTLFASHCDTVAIRFAQPIDLEAKIDQIEENDALAEALDYDSACSWFTLRLPHLLVEVTPTLMTCKLAGEANLAQLISQTQEALSRLAGAGLEVDPLAK